MTEAEKLDIIARIITDTELSTEAMVNWIIEIIFENRNSYNEIKQLIFD